MDVQRQDLFTVVHKAIRTMLYDLGATLQHSDFSDRAQSQAVLARLGTTLDMIGELARHENQFIFPRLRGFAAALIDDLEAEHLAAERLAGDVGAAAGAVAAARTRRGRARAGVELNTRYNEFLAAYLAHLNREEREALPATWAHFGDAEIGAMRTQIQQDTDPGRYVEWLRWMFCSQTAAELVTLFQGVKRSAPATILETMVRTAGETLGEQRWATISARAGLGADLAR